MQHLSSTLLLLKRILFNPVIHSIIYQKGAHLELLFASRRWSYTKRPFTKKDVGAVYMSRASSDKRAGLFD